MLKGAAVLALSEDSVCGPSGKRGTGFRGRGMHQQGPFHWWFCRIESLLRLQEENSKHLTSESWEEATSKICSTNEDLFAVQYFLQLTQNSLWPSACRTSLASIQSLALMESALWLRRLSAQGWVIKHRCALVFHLLVKIRNCSASVRNYTHPTQVSQMWIGAFLLYPAQQSQMQG